MDVTPGDDSCMGGEVVSDDLHLPEESAQQWATKLGAEGDEESNRV